MATDEAAPPIVRALPLAAILVDTATCQLRETKARHVIPGVDETIARGYAAAMEAGGRFPPLIVGDLSDEPGTLLLIDGHHRYRAAQIIGAREFPAITYAVTRDEAVVLALKANASHGRRFADKERNAGIARAIISGAIIPEGCASVAALAVHVAAELGRDAVVIRRLLYRLAQRDPRVAQALTRLAPPEVKPPASREAQAARRSMKRVQYAKRFAGLALEQLQALKRFEWLENEGGDRALQLRLLRQTLAGMLAQVDQMEA